MIQIQFYFYKVQKQAQLMVALEVRVEVPCGGAMTRSRHEGGLLSVWNIQFLYLSSGYIDSYSENSCRTHDLCILCICYASIENRII